MTPRPTVVLVAPAGSPARALGPSLRSAGFEPLLFDDFGSAKAALGSRPQLLITELRLGAFNGLHLAIRASGQGTPAIVTGAPDPVLEVEARRQHATYLTPPLDPEMVIGLARKLVSAAQHTRSSPRKRVPQIQALADGILARVLDVSYEGLRLEAENADPTALPSVFEFSMPTFNFACRVQRIWTASHAEPPSFSCGASLSAADATAALAWRALVDELPGVAITA